MAKDPVCGMTVDEKTAAATASYQGRTYYFCSTECKATFDKTPAKFAAGRGPDLDGAQDAPFNRAQER